jgi:NAD(P)-dependent dehydrogenase (short-subunit alcohol dehydrogenase family)
MTQKKIALVTGANRGIGYEICRQLGAAGCLVLAGSRDRAKGDRTAASLEKEGIEVRSMYIDMLDPSSFHAAYDDIEKRFGQLDILVNNAAISIDGEHKVDTIPINTVRETFEANVFSHIALTQVLLPLIRKSRAGRIVNHSSVLGSLDIHSKPNSPFKNIRTFAYNASKTALNAFTIHLADALEGTGIKVNSAHPGSVKTDMNQAGELDVVRGARTAVRLALLPDDGPSGGFFHLEKGLPW